MGAASGVPEGPPTPSLFLTFWELVFRGAVFTRCPNVWRPPQWFLGDSVFGEQRDPLLFFLFFSPPRRLFFHVGPLGGLRILALRRATEGATSRCPLLS